MSSLRWPPRAWLETLALASAPPVLGHLFHAADPAFLHGPFFWPLVAPLVAALRSGVAHGLAAAALVAVFVSGTTGFQGDSAYLAAGTLLVAIVAGEYRDHWHRRVEGAARVSNLASERTTRLARAYHALSVSHDRLVRERLCATPSLRELLADLQRLARTDPPQAGQALLDLLARHFGVRVASLHAVGPEGVGPALATLGTAPALRADDPVLREALRQRGLVSLDDAPPGGLVAALALADLRGHVGAVVALHDLPWEALQPASLKALGLVAGRAADLLQPTISPSAEHARTIFEQALEACVTDLERYDLPAALLCLELGANARLDDLASNWRVYDVAWRVDLSPSVTRLALVLPITDEAGAKALGERLTRHLSTGTTNPQFRFTTRALTKRVPAEAYLEPILERTRTDAPRNVDRLAGA